MATSVRELLGQEITCVAFARDGVEFHFDAAIVRSLAAPSVTIGDSTYRFPTAGSRDALCLVIGSTVESLDLAERQHFEFTTTNGCRVRIPLDAGREGASMQLIAPPDRLLRVL